MGHNSKGYELRYFARKFELTLAQANELLRKHGPDRAALNTAGARLRRLNQGKA